MNALDYNSFLEGSVCDSRGEALEGEPVLIDEVRRDSNSVLYASRSGQPAFLHEVSRLAEDALLLSTERSYPGAGQLNQIVRGGDWIHIQFCVHGVCYERFEDAEEVEAAAGSCVVARYPDECFIERRIPLAERARYACLFMKPSAINRLLDTTSSDLPEKAAWIATEGRSELQIRLLALQSSMSLAVNDILTCSYSGSARRAYMRAKSIELLSTVIHALNGAGDATSSRERLSTTDLLRIAQARAMMVDDTIPFLTLAALARRVGLNRSKLAYGFKHVYGVSVRQYWRDVKLDQSYRLLRTGNASITDLALGMGYSDPSSFTRAFLQKFGVLPRDCKNSD